MQPWAVENGTLWVWEADSGLPPFCTARVKVEFSEVNSNHIHKLTSAMNLPSSEPIQQRFNGKRRCFSFMIADQIVTYGWVTFGIEQVGELERQFHLHDDEAYIWDCGTVPAWRSHGLYSSLLSHILHQLHDEGIPRIWIGASRQNQPSIKGFANAGFEPVVDVTYRRLYRLTTMWIRRLPSARQRLVLAAYRILVSNHERRFGQLAIGYKYD